MGKLLAAAVVAALITTTAAAQYSPCQRPPRPLLPLAGSTISTAERNSLQLQISRYFDQMQRYVVCLSSEMESAKQEASDMIQIYEAFNTGAQ